VTSYRAPVEQTMHVLRHVLGFGARPELSGGLEVDDGAAILGEAARFCETVLHPLDAPGDAAGCRLEADGTVTTPAGFRAAYRQYAAGGWTAMTAGEAWGGQGVPAVLATAVEEYVIAANLAFATVPGLAAGAVRTLERFGTPEMQAAWLPHLVSGACATAMSLTEPQAGSDLGLVRTRAVPDGDGRHRLTGEKIFITGGDHDLAEDILHLVLARIEGAPAGTRGLSLFAVPKWLPGPEGAPVDRNGFACVRLEHKMGIRASPTCAIHYDDAVGWLVGEPHRGLAAMFTMMNEARLSVALQGVALAEKAGQNALAYARERRQGAAPAGEGAGGGPAAIVDHPDVRRMLMAVYSFTTAGRVLVLTTAALVDVAANAADAAECEAAEERLALLTPVLKGVLTQRGFEATVLAQQVLGGHGYIVDHGLEQIVRDARIAMLYEGTNGIQALDLVQRKLPRADGRAVRAWLDEADRRCGRAASMEGLAEFAGGQRAGVADLRAALSWLKAADPAHAAAVANDVMQLFGVVALGDAWVRIVLADLAPAVDDPAGVAQRRRLAHFFLRQTLPETALCLARVRRGAASIVDTSPLDL
jgi:alkylation response protein AidB-like acyl-CoA dehydrogenase